MTDAESETPHFDLKHQYAGVPMDGRKTLRRRQRGCSHRPRNLHLDYCSHTTHSCPRPGRWAPSLGEIPSHLPLKEVAESCGNTGLDQASIKRLEPARRH